MQSERIKGMLKKCYITLSWISKENYSGQLYEVITDNLALIGLLSLVILIVILFSQKVPRLCSQECQNDSSNNSEIRIMPSNIKKADQHRTTSETPFEWRFASGSMSVLHCMLSEWSVTWHNS